MTTMLLSTGRVIPVAHAPEHAHVFEECPRITAQVEDGVRRQKAAESGESALKRLLHRHCMMVQGA